MITGLLGWKLRNLSHRDKQLKLDYFTVNQIKFGLLSGNRWTAQVNDLLSAEIDSFELSLKNKVLLQNQVEGILHRLLDEVEIVLSQPQKKIGRRFRNKLIKGIIKIQDFRYAIPKFSSSIVEQLEKKENKESIKKLLHGQIKSILDQTQQDSRGEQDSILNLYGKKSIDTFNQEMKEDIKELEVSQYNYSYLLITCLLALIFLWLFLFKRLQTISTYFLLSAGVAIITLLVGISMPMIEIDARIAKLDLQVLTSHIIFEDQVIFFQTKSILDVISILISQGKGESTFVGILILLFSVLFPVTKLACAIFYLFRHKTENKFIIYMSFKSGKWSMADVMVIAIFMAYVGFRGILDDQLADITVHNETVNMISTNGTHLQPGFVIFTACVLYNLFLAELLRRITKREDNHT